MEIDRNFSDVLSAFLRSGVRGVRWPRGSYAVARYILKKETVFYRAKNYRGRHAEDAVIEHFKDLLKENHLKSQTIKIFFNNSPCHECSKKFIQFLDEAKKKCKIKLEIIFSGLYMVRRPSNVDNPNYNGRLPSEEVHQNQVDGLKKLQDTKGVELRPFRNEDWGELLEALGRRPEDDDLLLEDFDAVMNFDSSCEYTLNNKWLQLDKLLSQLPFFRRRC